MFAPPWILNAWNLAWFTWVTFSNKVETPCVFIPKKGLTNRFFVRHFQPLPVGGTVILSNSKVLPIRQVEAVQLNLGEIFGISCSKTMSCVFRHKKSLPNFLFLPSVFFLTRFQHGFFQFLQLRCLHDLRWQNGKMAVVTCAGPWAWRGDRFHAYLPQGGRVFLLGTFFLGRIEEHGGVLDNDVKLVGWSLLRSVVDIGVSRYNFLILYN